MKKPLPGSKGERIAELEAEILAAGGRPPAHALGSKTAHIETLEEHLTRTKAGKARFEKHRRDEAEAEEKNDIVSHLESPTEPAPETPEALPAIVQTFKQLSGAEKSEFWKLNRGAIIEALS